MVERSRDGFKKSFVIHNEALRTIRAVFYDMDNPTAKLM